MLRRFLGHPMKNVDLQAKAGSACWTNIVEIVQEHYNLHCTLPFLHYSDCSTMIAAMLSRSLDEMKHLIV